MDTFSNLPPGVRQSELDPIEQREFSEPYQPDPDEEDYQPEPTLEPDDEPDFSGATPGAR